MCDQKDEIGTVVVTIKDHVIKLVLDEQNRDPAEYGADLKLADHPELTEVKNSSHKQPWGTTMRALLNCEDGSLKFNDKKYRIQKGPKPEIASHVPNNFPKMTWDVIKEIKPGQTKNDWSNIGHDMTFHGRRSLTEAVQSFVEVLKQGPPKEKEEKCLVYSSVSGSGKTISFLQLKKTLRGFAAINDIDVAVSYLGFNSRLFLDEHELKHIRTVENARDVVARRLVVSTMITMNNPDVVDRLPHGPDVYKDFKIPSVADSKKLLLEYLDSIREDQKGKEPAKRKPLFIIAGVDEVQRLNRILPNVEGEGLGRHILRILRTWQSEWYNDGLCIVPVGTGITLDWAQESTEGTLWDLKGEDATLIKKEDFRILVGESVRAKENFDERVPPNTTRETTIELLAPSYWPRVRLLQWWKTDDPSSNLATLAKDSEWENWLIWMCHWLRDETMSIQNKKLIPGASDTAGNIHCLFEMKGDSEFTVFPDGYSWSSILEVLERNLPVQNLYHHLNVIKRMDPREFLTGNCYEIETFGFHVISLAIHLGLHAIESAPDSMPVSDRNATTLQRKRLGLALWLKGREVEFYNEAKKKMTPPFLVGNQPTSSGQNSPYYPFADSSQSSFMPGIIKLLKTAKTKQASYQPLHVKCGRRTCCDYMYFYVRKVTKSKYGFVIILVDAKHTSKDQGGEHSQGVTSDDQKGIYDAAVSVHYIMKKGVCLC